MTKIDYEGFLTSDKRSGLEDNKLDCCYLDITFLRSISTCCNEHVCVMTSKRYGLCR